eukprot:tig00021332_g20322.t1
MRTEYFKNGLHLAEAAAREVEVGFSADAALLLLCFVYTGTLDTELVGSDREIPTPELLVELLQAADYYGVPALCARAADLLARPGVVPVPEPEPAAPGAAALLFSILRAARAVREVAFERVRRGRGALLASAEYRRLAEGALEPEGAADSRRLLADIVAALAQG